MHLLKMMAKKQLPVFKPIHESMDIRPENLNESVKHSHSLTFPPVPLHSGRGWFELLLVSPDPVAFILKGFGLLFLLLHNS